MDNMHNGPRNQEEAFRLVLREETVLTPGAAGSLQMRLEQGGLEAVVTPRLGGPPLVFATPQATATVVGTRFTLASDAATTPLAVREGRVRLQSESQPREIIPQSQLYPPGTNAIHSTTQP